jgi:hypothetical protein
MPFLAGQKGREQTGSADAAYACSSITLARTSSSISRQMWST